VLRQCGDGVATFVNFVAGKSFFETRREAEAEDRGADTFLPKSIKARLRAGHPGDMVRLSSSSMGLMN